MKPTKPLLRPMTRAILMALALTPTLGLAQTQNTTTQYQYDAVGNVTHITDPLNHVTRQLYDPLNRLVTRIDANTGATQYTYDGLDQLASIADPRNVTTQYQTDGLGNQLALFSPDTGATLNTVDEAGNILTRTDAKGQLTQYQYDALNRVTRITYHDASVITYSYDQGPNGIGQLSFISDSNNNGSSNIGYSYDGFGNVTGETRTIAGIPYLTSYTHDAAGRLQTMTYPNGRIVSYGRDPLGRINQINTTKDGVTIALVTNVTYQPFGPVQSILFANGQASTRSYDLDGRTASYSLNGAIQNISYDAASRITGITDPLNPGRNASYGYDVLDRLTNYQLPGTSHSYGYDATGNRTSKTNFTATTSYNYQPNSNQLTTISSGATTPIVTDLNGSITNNGNNQFSYDARGRMVAATTIAGPVQYQINALGQRVMKTGSNGATLFHYDRSGKLISESSAQGNSDFVYLGDIPVAVLK